MMSNSNGEIKWLASRVGRSLALVYLLSFCCSLAGSLILLLDPLIIKWLIDDVFARHSLKWLAIAVCAFLSVYIAHMVLDGLGALLNYQASQKMVFRIRLKLLRHLQSFSAKYYETTQVGDILYRLEQDVDQLIILGSDVAPYSLRVLVGTPLVIVAMLTLSVPLTCALVPMVPLFILVSRYYRKRLGHSSDLVEEKSSEVSHFLQEHFSAMLQIQLLSRELSEARRFARLASSLAKAQIKRRKEELIFGIVAASIVISGVVFILGYGGYLVLSGTLSTGALVALYGFAVQLFGPLYGTAGVYSKLQRIRASIRRIIDVTRTEGMIKDRPGASSLSPDVSGAVELRDVHFSYKPGVTVLSGVSLQINPGQKVALVGANGSGKSTIAKLIARLYDIPQGMILIDGLNAQDVTLKSIRTIISLVPQNPILFDATIRENLLYGNPKASQLELKEAAALAQIEDLIKLFPNGWDEPVGTLGSKLSGGERQRIALARALLQRPRILILDEITTALDASIEKCVLDGLDRFARGRTTIIISHKLSTILWADRVLVLDSGKIVEDGAPDALPLRNGAYSRLFKEQFEIESPAAVQGEALVQ